MQKFLDTNLPIIMEIIDFQEGTESSMKELFEKYKIALRINSMEIQKFEHQILDKIKEYDVLKLISEAKVNEIAWDGIHA